MKLKKFHVFAYEISYPVIEIQSIGEGGKKLLIITVYPSLQDPRQGNYPCKQTNVF